MQTRRNERVSTNIATVGRMPASFAEVTVIDLSTVGCQIHTCSPLARVGATILLSLSDRDDVAGQIVWKEAERCGVQFFNDLSEEAIDWIAIGVA